MILILNLSERSKKNGDSANIRQNRKAAVGNETTPHRTKDDVVWYVSIHVGCSLATNSMVLACISISFFHDTRMHT